jgi:hypothetical protein
MDYLLSTKGHISAVDLSEVLDGRFSHDQISRLLYSGEVDDKRLYLKWKKLYSTKRDKRARSPFPWMVTFSPNPLVGVNGPG